MSATREFIAVRARVPNAYNSCAVYLIDAEDLQEFPNIADYFPPGTRDVQEVGRIQITGDSHLLGTMYSESL